MQTYLSSAVLFLLILLLGCNNQSSVNEIRVTGVEQPEILLNGTWKFIMNPPTNFWENKVDHSTWPDIQVPGECQMQGFAIKHDQPYVYKHAFKVPEDFKNKVVQLNFYGVYSYARVWVNGIFVRDHTGGFTKWSCDITELVIPGEEAVLTLEFTDRTDDISYGSGYAKHQIGGILKDVELIALPTQHFRQLWYETDLDEYYQDAELKVFYELNDNKSAEMKVELMDATDKVITTVTGQVDNTNGQFTIPVANPLKWDAEHPNLYTVRTTLFEQGEELMVKSEKIGFREVEVKGNQLLVNGQAVKLRGACRHDIHPTLGRMTTPEYDLKDVLLAKECNMNFIRTSHYPPSEQFLKYCDEYGLYVEDETAVCFVGSHRTQAYRASGASQSDSAFTSIYLSQLEEMVLNHRNHPSVIIWSIGNENHFGTNFIDSYEWVKKTDQTRPVIYSYPGLVPDSLDLYDIISMHYPDWQGNLGQYGINTRGFASPDKPMLFDEWAHVACYNNFELKDDPNVRNFWSQSLDSMWTYLFEADGGLGGAIWCMLDETFMLPEDLEGYNEWWGILDKHVIPSTYMGPTVGYGEWGIVDTWRRKKPEFWGTKKAYSPTKIYSKQIEDFSVNKELMVPVHNRFDHTNFKEIKIVWQYGNQSGELNAVDLAPHQKGFLQIPANDWRQGELLNIRFYQADTLLVDEYKLRLGQAEVELPALAKGELEIKEAKDYLFVSGKSYDLKLNLTTGLLEDLVVDKDTLLKTGPMMNLKLPGKAVQYSTLQMDDYAQNWAMEECNWDVTKGWLTVVTKGQYENVKAEFIMQMDAFGVMNINYQVTGLPANKNIQEVGLKFITGTAFEMLSWNREGYFTTYPEHHIGSSSGQADLKYKGQNIYREKPNADWSFDREGFYYFGLDAQLPFTNMARSMKENIYVYSLQAGNIELSVLSEGKQACRFDEIKGVNTLLVNDLWDYTSLLWGNYWKRIKTDGTSRGRVIFQLSK